MMEDNAVGEFTIKVNTVEIHDEWEVYVSGIEPCCHEMCSHVFEMQDMKVKSIGPRHDILPYLVLVHENKPMPIRHCIFCGNPVVIRDNHNGAEIKSRTNVRTTIPGSLGLTKERIVERITASDVRITRGYTKG